MSRLIYRETKYLLVQQAKHEKVSLSSLLLGTSIITGSGVSEIAPGTNDLILVCIIEINFNEIYNGGFKNFNNSVILISVNNFDFAGTLFDFLLYSNNL